MSRRFLTLVFAFLLLGMQHEAQLHALVHAGEQFNRPHEQGLNSPTADAVCAECALLAAGSGVAPASSAAVPAAIARFVAPTRGFPSWAVAAPSYYSSRGPPTTL